ncbi:MAG: DUF4214 domain-containing protein [Acidobacteriia bacterium]|nr:DUF4214 domain-containing protein [Terriglobia bacterium]
MNKLQTIFATAFLAASGSLWAAGANENSSETAVAANVPTHAAAVAGSRAKTGVADDIFLSRVFQDLYGRSPIASEVEAHLSALKAGTTTRGEIVATLFNAPEFRDNAAYVVKCYLTIMRRDPDFTGWSQIYKLMRAGTMEETVLSAFLKTPEYAAAYPANMSDAAFLETVYHNMLGREPNAEEVDSLRSKLDQGGARGEVLQTVLTSPEFDAHIAGRVNANLAFLAFLRRGGDAAGLEKWTAALQSGVPVSDLVGAFIASPGYASRF